MTGSGVYINTDDTGDIFISYRTAGGGTAIATQLVENLRKAGYSVYFNPDAYKSDDYEVRLEAAIKACKDFLCIVTPDYLKSLYNYDDVSYVRKELLWAREKGKRIRPVVFGKTDMMPSAENVPEELEFFSKIDAVELPDRYLNSPFDDLCRSLASTRDGMDKFRDVYNSNLDFRTDTLLYDITQMAENGSAKDMYLAGVYHFYGIAGRQDYKEAARFFLKVTKTNSEYALLACKFIGRLYYIGAIPREMQSYEKSFDYHMKAAALDDFSARHVACMMAIGSGCEFDYDKTEAYFLSILDRCDMIGKKELCMFYVRNGEFCKAAEIYKEIADNSAQAAYELGMLYKNGVLSAPHMPDYESAAVYFAKAAEKGHITSACELGKLYFNPTGSFRGDFKKAQKYLEIAADGGDQTAQYMLGFMYEYGHIEKNLKKAIDYYEMAYSQGNVLSASHLATLYQQPEVHNYERAFKCCLYAAEGGDAVCEFMLGVLYLCGTGCEPDPDKAYMYFKKASTHGAPEAKLLMAQMEELGL